MIDTVCPKKSHSCRFNDQATTQTYFLHTVESIILSSPLHYRCKKTSPDHTTSLEMTGEETDQELWLQILQSRSAELAPEHKQLSRTT